MNEYSKLYRLMQLPQMVGVFLLIMLAGFWHSACAEDGAASTSSAQQLITEAQLASAVGNIGTIANTDTATNVYLPYLGLSDVSSFAKKARFGTEFDTKGRNWALVYMPIYTPVNKWTKDMVSLSAGFAYRISDRIGAFMVGPVFQADNIVDKISGGKYSIPSLDLVSGVQACYQASASPDYVGIIGLAYGFSR